MSTLSSQVSLHSRYEALELEGQGHPSMLEESPRSGQPIPCIMTTSNQMVNGLEDVTYEEQLRIQGLLSLEKNRLGG